MNVYTCKGFTGHYPVGTAAVVIAANRMRAVQALETALATHGLAQTINPDDLVLLDLTHQQVIVLNDGNY
jgi:hypothetical protein